MLSYKAVVYMKRKDCISMSLKMMRVNHQLGDIDRRDKEEIKKLDASYRDKILALDTGHLENLRRSILNRRYELDNHVVSFGPDLWSIDLLIDDEYNNYMAKKSVDDLLSEGTQKSKKRGPFRRTFIL